MHDEIHHSRPAFPRMGGVMTVFYHDDLRTAVAFYEDMIGFEKVLDLGWVASFRMMRESFLTIVDGVSGNQQPVGGPNKGAALSIETDDLARWRERLLSAGVPGAYEVVLGCDGRSREFHVCDPSGYIIEFFEWIDPPAGWKNPG